MDGLPSWGTGTTELSLEESTGTIKLSLEAIVGDAGDENISLRECIEVVVYSDVFELGPADVLLRLGTKHAKTPSDLLQDGGVPLSLMLSLIVLLLILALGESFSEYMQGHWYEKQFAQGFVPVHFIFLLLQLSHALLTFVLLLLGGGNWLISLAIFCRFVVEKKLIIILYCAGGY